MKLLRNFLFVAFAVVSLAFVTAGPAAAQSGILLQVRSGSRFTLDRKASAPRGHVKAFDAITRQMLKPSKSVVITHTTSEVNIKFDNSAPLKSPLNGQPVTWTRSDGAKFKLTSSLKNGSLIQVLTSSNETITRTYTVSGSTLIVKLEVSGQTFGVWEYRVVATGEI